MQNSNFKHDSSLFDS